MNEDQAWEAMRGMTWAWEYCAAGTAAQNAPGLQAWFARRDFGVSLRVCRRLSAAVQRFNAAPFGRGLGRGIGQLAL